MAHVLKKQQGPLCLEHRWSGEGNFWRAGGGKSHPTSYRKDVGFDAKCAGKPLEGRQQGSDRMSLILQNRLSSLWRADHKGEGQSGETRQKATAAPCRRGLMMASSGALENQWGFNNQQCPC